MKDCLADAPYTPVLHIAQQGKTHISSVALPVHLCRAHRSVFLASLLSAEQRSKMEGSLRARGRALPDWSRTTVEFVRPD